MKWFHGDACQQWSAKKYVLEELLFRWNGMEMDMSHMTYAERPTIELEKRRERHAGERQGAGRAFFGSECNLERHNGKLKCAMGGTGARARAEDIVTDADGRLGSFFLRVDSSSDLWGFGPVAVVERLSEMEPPAAVAEMSSSVLSLRWPSL